MDREYYVMLIINLFLCVVYDLACSPLLVEALAKFLLLTPRGSIYARLWVHASIKSGTVTESSKIVDVLLPLGIKHQCYV